MEELLVRLERQLKAFIDQHKQLHHGQSKLIHEKELLLSQQQKAITQIQSLVSKLKSTEKSS